MWLIVAVAGCGSKHGTAGTGGTMGMAGTSGVGGSVGTTGSAGTTGTAGKPARAQQPVDRLEAIGFQNLHMVSYSDRALSLSSRTVNETAGVLELLDGP